VRLVSHFKKREIRAPRSHKPGEIVPRSGIYKVEHDSHRLMHEAALIQGARFPRCRQCKDEVRFTLSRAVRDEHAILPFRSSTILEDYEEPDSSLPATAT
jgi:hypothetical protein